MSGRSPRAAGPGADDVTAPLREPCDDAPVGCCGCFSGIAAALRRKLSPHPRAPKQCWLRRRLAALLRRKQSQSPSGPSKADPDQQDGDRTPEGPGCEAPLSAGGVHGGADSEGGVETTAEQREPTWSQRLPSPGGFDSPPGPTDSPPGLTQSAPTASSSGASPAAPPAEACPPPQPAEDDDVRPATPTETGAPAAAEANADHVSSPEPARNPGEIVIAGHFTATLAVLAQSDYGIVCPAGLVAGPSAVPLAAKLSCVMPSVAQESLDRARRPASWVHPHLIRTLIVLPAPPADELDAFVQGVYGEGSFQHRMPKYWTIMERGVRDLHDHLIEAATLQRHVGAEARIPAADAVRWCGELSGAVEYLHTTAGYIHADIKPKNIIMVIRGDQLQAVLADLEDALPVASRDKSGMTPFYLAPERWRERTTQNKQGRDIWALGVTAHFVLTGGHMPADMIECLQDDTGELTYHSHRGAPECIERVLSCCWRRSCRKRPSAKQLQEAFSQEFAEELGQDERYVQLALDDKRRPECDWFIRCARAQREQLYRQQQQGTESHPGA